MTHSNIIDVSSFGGDFDNSDAASTLSAYGGDATGKAHKKRSSVNLFKFNEIKPARSVLHHKVLLFERLANDFRTISGINTLNEVLQKSMEVLVSFLKTVF